MFEPPPVPIGKAEGVVVDPKEIDQSWLSLNFNSVAGRSCPVAVKVIPSVVVISISAEPPQLLKPPITETAIWSKL